MIAAKYQIDGQLKNGVIDGAGVIRTDRVSGYGEVEVAFRSRPHDWDPRTIILCCCSRAIGAVAHEIDGALSLMSASGGRTTIGIDLPGVFRQAAIIDEGGVLRAQIAASSTTDLSGPNPFDSSHIVGGFCELEPGFNGIAAIEGVSGVMMQVTPRLLSLTTRYAIVAEDGRRLHGATFYPHYLPVPTHVLPGVQLFDLVVDQLEFDGRTMFAKTRATVSPMVASSALAFA